MNQLGEVTSTPESDPWEDVTATFQANAAEKMGEVFPEVVGGL